jgi:hypothetical protein
MDRSILGQLILHSPTRLGVRGEPRSAETMKRVLWIIGLSSMALAGAFFGWVVFQPYFNTNYATQFKRKQFALIHTNATLDENYRLIGPPLFVQVNNAVAGNGRYRQKRDYNVDLER